MEENTLELSFEVDVSEGDEEEDRNYSLDSDNDDGDLGDFDPEAGENQVPRCPGGGGALTFGKGRGVWPQNLKPYP